MALKPSNSSNLEQLALKGLNKSLCGVKYGDCVQGLLCSGGRRNACGRRHLPGAGQPSATSFIRSVNMDPLGSGHWRCPASRINRSSSRLNSYTFVGSYYHVYVKLASCPPPKGQRRRPHALYQSINQSITEFLEWPK